MGRVRCFEINVFPHAVTYMISKSINLTCSNQRSANEICQAIALVVDPKFGAHLKTLATRMHTWTVSSAENDRVAKEIWRTD